MLKKKEKQYILNRSTICIKIRKLIRRNIIKSIIQNQNIKNEVRVLWHIKLLLSKNIKTSINDLCLFSGMYKKSNKKFNISRYELHNLCRSNLLNNFNVNSW